jgi:hypothetical protein
MAIVDSTGTKLTKAQLLAKTTNVPQPTVVRLNEDIWETYGLPGAKSFEDGKNAGRKKLYRAGQAVPQAEIDAKYAASAAVISAVAPVSGVAAGNVNVTITGQGFSGATGATFGGTAATAFKVVSDTKITCKTPARAVGVVDVVVQDASGPATKTGGFTYTA